MHFWEGGINIPLFGKPNIEKMKLKHDFKGLTKALGHRDKNIQNQAVNALVEMGKAAVKPLIAVLANKDLYRSAMEVIGKIGGAAVEPLTTTLNDKKANSLVRERVVCVLGEIKDTRVVGLLTSILKDVGEDLSVRRCVAEALGLIGDKQAVEPLLVLLSDRDRTIRSSALLALGKIGDERAVEPLIEALSDPYSFSTSDIIVMLGQIGDRRALEPIIHTIKNVDFSDATLCSIAEVLGKFGDERAVEPLTGILQRRPKEYGDITLDAVLRAQQGKNVDWKRERSNTSFLSFLARVHNSNMRLAAVRALGKIGGAKAADALMIALKDTSDPTVQSEALQVWTSIQSRRTANILRKYGRTLGDPVGRGVEPAKRALRKPTSIITGKPVFSGAGAGKSPPIFAAVESENVEQLKALLKEDPGLVNARTRGRSTPLIHAVARKNAKVEVTRVLLAHGADVNAQQKAVDGTAYGNSALHMAASWGNLEVVELLLAHDADVNILNKHNKFTPLHYAINRPEIVELLLVNGADVNAQIWNGQSVLQMAIDPLCVPRWRPLNADRTKTVEILLANGADVNNFDNQHATALHYAVRGHWVEIVRLLIEKIADVNAHKNVDETKVIGDKGGTPLHLAVSYDALECGDVSEHNTLEIVRLLIEKGADVNALNSKGFTPLQLAEQNHYPKVAELLRHRGTTKPAFEGGNLENAIFGAIKSEDVEQVKVLLNEDPRLVNSQISINLPSGPCGGWTPLHQAASQGSVKLAELLLDKGAEIDAILIGTASYKGGRMPLHEAVIKGHVEMVKLLIQRGASVEARERDSGRTPIFFAATSCHVEVARALLSCGSSIETKDKYGQTALMISAGKGDVEMVRLLLASGAEVNTKTNDLMTPLHSAAMFGHLEVAKLLVENGADVNAKAWEGSTPLSYAEHKHHTEVAEVLRKNGGILGKFTLPGFEPSKFASPTPKAVPTATKQVGNIIRGSESPEVWAERLKDNKDFRSLAAINNSEDYSPEFKLFKRKNLANQILREAGAEAVDAIMEELDTDGVGSIELAKLLVQISATKAVPLLKKKLDRGLFDCWGSKVNIERFVNEHKELVGEEEMVTCALCGKIRPVTETQLFYDENGKVKRFCKDTCWGKRGRVLKSGIGTDCPFYSEGICTAGNGDSLCSLKVGSYESSCHVYAMYRGAAKRP